jgi:hypothetical protein
MPPVFRHPPPIELALKLLHTVGLQTFHDTTTFLKETIQLREFETLLPELEPFYIPCKAQDFLHSSLTPKRAITILRHVLRAHGVNLCSVEKTFSNQKVLWYQLSTPSTTAIPEEGITIEFS